MWCKSNGGLEGECDGFSLICVCPVPVKTAGGYTHSRGCRFGLRAECQQETMIYNKQTGTRGTERGGRAEDEEYADRQEQEKGIRIGKVKENNTEEKEMWKGY